MKKQKKLGFLALIGLVAVASIFTVCKASGANNVYVVPQWKVTFDTGGGLPEPEPNPVTVADGETIGKLPEVDPAKDGFSFGGWYLGDSEFDPGMPITRDITVRAKWIGPAKEGHYHVTFKGAGGSPDTYVEENVPNNGTVDPLPGVKRTGYTFIGWYPAESETEFTASTPVTGAITLFAKWTDITYTVSYNAGNEGTGSMDPSTHTYGVPRRLSAISTGTISYAGHEFKGWAKSAESAQWQYDDNEEVINLAVIDGAVVPLYAVWQALPPPEAVYDYTAHSNSWNDLSQFIIDNQGDANAVGKPARIKIINAGVLDAAAMTAVNGKVSDAAKYVSLNLGEGNSFAENKVTSSVMDDIIKNNSYIKGIALPEGVTGFTGNEELVYGNPNYYVYHYAFTNCQYLTSITLPSSVTTIGAHAFENCTGLVSITLPSSVTDIEWCAFKNCTSLANISWPASLTRIQDTAFSGCTSLTSIDMSVCTGTVTLYDHVFTGYLVSSGLVSATLGTIDFSYYYGQFPGDDGEGGDDMKDIYDGPGTYTRAPAGTLWTKQP
jgi:uncharacterized repeat protein (TIGR02543 family)